MARRCEPDPAWAARGRRRALSSASSSSCPRTRPCCRISFRERRDWTVTSPAEWPELDSSGDELSMQNVENVFSTPERFESVQHYSNDSEAFVWQFQWFHRGTRMLPLNPLDPQQELCHWLGKLIATIRPANSWNHLMWEMSPSPSFPTVFIT